MELRQLHCFVICAQAESFSKAAAILYTSQSNVSKTIASLEEELGRKLFERRQRGIELTEKGKQIYQYAMNMMKYTSQIMECVKYEEVEEMRVSFQPNSWFATAFSEYYLNEGSREIRYHMTSAMPDEIIRRIADGQDQLGFAYMETKWLKKLQDVFRTDHIGYYVLQQTKLVLYCGEKSDLNSDEDLHLIQDSNEFSSRITEWKMKFPKEERKKNAKVLITTNSDAVLQEILKKTDLSSIRPQYLRKQEDAESSIKTVASSQTEETEVQFVCMFRNDRALEKVTKQFLNYIREYVKK